MPQACVLYQRNVLKHWFPPRCMIWYNKLYVTSEQMITTFTHSVHQFTEKLKVTETCTQLRLCVITNLTDKKLDMASLAAFPHKSEHYLPKYHCERETCTDREKVSETWVLPTLCPPESVGMSGTWKVRQAVMLFCSAGINLNSFFLDNVRSYCQEFVQQNWMSHKSWHLHLQ